MKTFGLLIFLSLLALTGVFADESLRAVQQALKDQGFYYGPVDGEPGTETAAAIKRYQIRNGLQVTGQPNPETLAAMNPGGSPAAPAPSAQVIEPQAPVGAPANDLKNQPLVTPPPPVPAPAPVNPFSMIFRRTPYENAPGEVQQNTLKRAQMKLCRDGFYRGPIDGTPGNGTTQALLRYQADEGLPRTGRLDMETLASLELLPRSGPAHPYYPVPGRPVYRGIWIH